MRRVHREAQRRRRLSTRYDRIRKRALVLIVRLIGKPLHTFPDAF